MKLIIIIITFVLLALSGCGGGGGSVINPAPPSGGWRFDSYSVGMAGSPCDNFNYPPPPSGVHSCVRSMSLQAGQTISMTFTISGDGRIGISDPNDGPPPTVRLFLQRRGDNYSGVGSYQQYRYYGHPTVAITGPGTYTLRVPISPENWTDVFAAYGSQYPAQFQALLNDLDVVGYVFGGGSFAAHGQYLASGSVRFTLESFGVGYNNAKRKIR